MSQNAKANKNVSESLKLSLYLVTEMETSFKEFKNIKGKKISAFFLYNFLFCLCCLYFYILYNL